MRFRRRTLHPRRLAKYEQGSAGFRAFRLGSMAFLAGSGVYFALFADFGTGDHCFTSIRKQFQTVRAKALALSEADTLGSCTFITILYDPLTVA
ncbi:hypothetical protein HDU81_010052 [Chytriomyces hyalinus]|nr:hypothetical protein HDU81_010052 [Chytriomyces hyalinus]